MAAVAARGPRITATIPRALAKARERDVLRACGVGDFEFMSVIGGGCNGIVCIGRCLNTANPFAATKVYAIKIVMNMGGDPTVVLRERYQKEFLLYGDMLPLRSSYEAAGKRDGLVTFYHMFTGMFPEYIRPMMDPEIAATCFPLGQGTCDPCYWISARNDTTSLSCAVYLCVCVCVCMCCQCVCRLPCCPLHKLAVLIH
jgi:hypothetical protein